MRVLMDDELLVEEDRKDHRHDHGRGIVEGMEKRGGKEDSFFHREQDVGYIPNGLCCQFERFRKTCLKLCSELD